MLYIVITTILIVIPTNILALDSENSKEWTDIIDLTPNANEINSFDIALDSPNNLHLVWQDQSKIYYKKIDPNGSPLIDSQIISGGSDPTIAVDSTDNIFVFFQYDSQSRLIKFDVKKQKWDIINKNLTGWNILVDKNDNIYVQDYFNITKLDSDGNVLIERMEIPHTSVGKGYGYLRTAIDSKNNLNVIWIVKSEGSNNLAYAKINDKGETIIEDRLIYEYNSSILSYWSTYIAIDSKDNIHIVIRTSSNGQISNPYYMKIDTNRKVLINETKLPFNTSEYVSTHIDSEDNLHVICDGFYGKFDNNGNILINPNYHKGIPWGRQLTINSNDKLHIVWIAMRHGVDVQLFYKTTCISNPTLTDLSFSKTKPKENEKVRITATVHNEGNTNSSKLLVKFFDNGKQIGENQTIEPIMPGKNGTATIEYSFKEQGNHTINAVVYLNNTEIIKSEISEDITVYAGESYEFLAVSLITVIIIVVSIILIGFKKSKKYKSN